jgi:aminocarboxymuconate-semialdehyde decarboxylase
LKTAAIGAAIVSSSAGLPKSGQTRERRKAMVIDMHSHVEIPEAIDLIPEKPRPLSSPLSAQSADYQRRLMGTLTEKYRNPEKRIADMETMGIDMAILSITPPQFFYNLEGNLAIDVSRNQNEQIAAIVRKYPKKFAGMATVPLQNPEAAVAELERAILDLKLKGVHVASNIRGKYLGDPSFLPFFEKVTALDVPVFIHPTNVVGTERMKDFYFPNLIGNPLDTTITGGHLIFSGIFDRLPNLKIILAHAGGLLPYNIDRWGHGFKVRPECQEFLKKSPVEYIKKFYYDTISHGPEPLQYLLSRVGADRVVVGTDYPADMGDVTPVKSVNAVKLAAKGREKIFSKNVISLFKLAV